MTTKIAPTDINSNDVVTDGKEAWNFSGDKKEKESAPPKKASKKKRCFGAAIFVILLLAGATVGILIGTGVLGKIPTALSVAETNTTVTNQTNSSTAIDQPEEDLSAVSTVKILPAQLTLSGIKAAEFSNEQVQAQFREAVASGLTGIGKEQIRITAFKDETIERRTTSTRIRRLATSTRLVIDFVVLTNQPSRVVTILQDAPVFLGSVTSAFSRKTGPLTLASILVDLYQPPTEEDVNKSSNECTFMDKPMATAPAVLNAGSTHRLKLSGQQDIFFLQVIDTQLAPLLGRSYGGMMWEAAPGAPNVFQCCLLWCSVTLPVLTTGTTYQYKQATTQSTPARGSPASISRLLSQGTFGPTSATIDALQQKIDASTVRDPIEKEMSVFKQWVDSQLKMPPSLHRAYYRKRANPRISKGLILPTGSNREPCAKDARYRRYVFDDTHRTKTITAVKSNGFVSLTVDNALLSVVAEQDFITGVTNTTTSYLICSKGQPGISQRVQEWVNGTLTLSNNNDCTSEHKRIVTANNPAVAFLNGAAVPASLQTFAADQIAFTNIDASWGKHAPLYDDVVVKSVQSSVTCKAGMEYIQLDTGSIYVRDYRMEMVDNTLDAPADKTVERTTTSGTCPSVPVTFLNRKNCVRRPSCSPVTYTSKMITLDHATMRQFYQVSGKLIYSVSNLRLEDNIVADKNCWKQMGGCNPCTTTVSRWKHVALATSGGCVSATTMDANTTATVAAAIAASTDANPHVIDLNLKSAVDAGKVCLSGAAFGGSLVVGNKCYTHVHRHAFSVVDATYWSDVHDGNTATFKPVEAFARKGLTELSYPASHPISRFDAVFKLGGKERVLGRLDDTVDLKDMHPETINVQIAKHFNAVGANANNGTHLACGSPGEVANDPSLAHKFAIKLAYVDPGDGGKYDHAQDPHATEAKRTVNTAQALHAPDQLRQRVAWSLSQIFVIR
jgi:cullin-associated NEDD8-dissociated protein 1